MEGNALKRKKAIVLRKEGKTFSEIRNYLEVSKSTLSGWLSKYPLTDEQLQKLQATIVKNRYIAAEKIRNTKRNKREARLKQVLFIEEKNLLPVSARELYLCGLFLYSGEGVKGLNSTVSLNNTDPNVVLFYYYWLTDILKVPKKKIRVSLHLYSDMDIKESINYWSRQLHIPTSQFIKPHVKLASRESIDQKGYGHGTCGIYVYDARLKEKIIFGIQAISQSIKNDLNVI